VDKSKKMLHALMGLEIGGAETHVVELVKELKRQGYDVIVASNGGIYEKELQKAGIKHYKVPLNDRNIFNFIKSYKLLKKIIKEENVELVHAHARIPGFICGLLHRKMKFTFVTTAHWVFFTGMGLKYITNWGQKVIAVSSDIKKYLMDNYKTKEEDIFLTINGIDTDKFSPDTDKSRIRKELAIKEEDKVIVYVSRLDTDRSQVAFELAECAQELDSKIENLKIIIVGGGNQFNEMQQKAQSINSKLGKKVIYLTGARADINELVAVGDIFIGVSRAVLEAMAAAKPVIISGNEGYIGVFDMDKLQNAIENNFTCRGNELSSKEKILKDVLYLFSLSEEERKELGAKGRQVIFDYYSVTKMANDCIKAYDAALSESAKQVLILGYYGFGNWGDEASLSTIINMIKKTSADTKINVLSYNGKETYEDYGVNGISRNSFKEIAKYIKKSDMIIFGGGTLLQDVTSSRSLYYYLFIVWLAKRYNKKTVFFSNGFGPIIKNKAITAKIANMADDIIVRDKKSKDMMEALGINKKIYISTDVVFDLKKNSHIEKKNKIAVSLRPWKHSQGLTKKIAQAINILIKRGYLIDLISLQQVDEKVLKEVYENLDNKGMVSLYRADSYKKIMDKIGEAKIMIGMRLHANIFALINDMPIIAIDYDPKIEALAQDFGQEIISLNDENMADKIVEAVENIEKDYGSKAEEVRIKTQGKRELLKINYNYLRKNL